jgi:hypothetical protein
MADLCFAANRLRRSNQLHGRRWSWTISKHKRPVGTPHMKRKIPIEQLLRWRLAQAKAAVPPAPPARRLLDVARPWWETQPEQFQALAKQLGRIRIAEGRTVAKPKASNGRPPIPVLMIHRGEKLETFAHIIYFSVRDGSLCLRLRLKIAALKTQQGFEVTFVNSELRPLFSAAATSLKNKEYRLEVELSEPLARDWEKLKVKDRMPFRLLIHSG